MKGIIALVFLLLCVVSTRAKDPPKLSLGHSRGMDSAPIKFEAFVDFSCFDSAASWIPVQQVLEHFGDDKIHFTLYPISLWFFFQSPHVALAAEVISDHVTNEVYWELVSYLFLNQASFNGDDWFNKSRADLYHLLSTYATKFGVDNSTFYSGMRPSVSNAAWQSVAYNMDYSHVRSIMGTPTFFVNGFQLDGTKFGPKTTFAEWVQFFDTLMSNQN